MEEIQYSDPKTGEDTAVKETAHSPSARRSQNPPNILEKLGKFTIAAVIFGTSVIIVANVLLALFWTDHHLFRWISRQLVARNWSTRFVTLLGVAIRVSVVAQCGICVSMLAALALENDGVPKKYVAKVSLTRAQSVNPYELLFPLWAGPITRRKFSMLSLALAITATFLAVQFIAPILLTDFGVGYQYWDQSLGISYGLDLSQGHPLKGPQYQFAQPTYPIFAEALQPPPPAVDGISDTGTTIRAFLPIANSTFRQEIRSYVGKATVTDTRVVCVRPDPNSIITLLRQGDGSLFVQGEYSPESTDLPNLSYNSSYQFPGSLLVGAHNGCTASFENKTDADDWAVSLCWSPQFYSSSQVLDGYFVVNITGSELDWSQQLNQSSWLPTIASSFLSPVPDNEWLRYKGPSIEMALSFCYWAGHAVDIDVTAGTDFGDSPSEPQLSFNGITDRWNTGSIRDQLGNTANTQHYTWKLANTFTQTDFVKGTPYSLEWEYNPSGSLINPQDLSDPGQPVPDLALCSFCRISNNPSRFQYRLHPVQAAVFRDILSFKTQLSQAMQSYVTTQFQMKYYDVLVQFNQNDTASIVASVPVLIPVQYTAFIIMGGILCLHLLLVLVISWLFVIGTNYTRLGNTWQAVSQLQSDELQDVFDEDASESDTEAHHAHGNRRRRRRGRDRGLQKLVVLVRGTIADSVLS